MKKILVLLLVTYNSLSLFSMDLVKTGVYDFQQLITQMGEEPNLRTEFPDALKEKLFLPLMLKNKLSTLRKPSIKIPWEKQAKDYIYMFSLQSLIKKQEKQSASSQKSSAIKNKILLGVTLVRQYRGFSIILKPHSGILYSNTDLNKNMANVIGAYIEKSIITDEEQYLENSQGATL